MGGNVFPQTMHTWIGRELGLGPDGRLKVNEHIMAAYAFPLRVYYLGTDSRWLGEAEDLVAGFFADRLARPDFLDKWQASGRPLRRWLMTAFNFYLKEQRRARRRDPAHLSDPDGEVTFEGDPDRAMDRAVVVSFVRTAIETTRTRCAEQGLDDHLSLFLRHHLEGEAYADLAPEFRVTPDRAAVMARTAGRKFRLALRDLLERDGVAADQMDEEIRSLLGSL